jgi:hypothetical protein
LPLVDSSGNSFVGAINNVIQVLFIPHWQFVNPGDSYRNIAFARTAWRRRMRRTFVLSASAALLASIILAATGVVLSTIYHDAVERSFDRRLRVYLGTVVADVVSSDRVGPPLGEPSFDLPLSGWYWQITTLDVAKPEVRSSPSLWDMTLTRLRDEVATTSADRARHGYAIGRGAAQRLRLLERTVDLGEDGRYLIVVAGDPQEIDDEMRSFHKAIAISFGFVAALLALMMFFQTRLVRISSFSERSA